jgi:probable blue pigment (indigoidine) exporter
MSVGVVLAKRWSGDQPAVALTAWQLLAGGLVLAVLTAVFEPLPTTAPSGLNVVGYLYLTLIGTAVAYLLWFRGIAALPTRIPAFLGLLSPLVALALGVSLAHESLSVSQLGGVALVLVSIAVVIMRSGGRPTSSR